MRRAGGQGKRLLAMTALHAREHVSRAGHRRRDQDMGSSLSLRCPRSAAGTYRTRACRGNDLYKRVLAAEHRSLK